MVFYGEMWTKLMKILEGTSIDFRERRLTKNYVWIGVLKKTGPRRHGKCEDWTRCEGRVLFVTDSI
jgi:hypothetical protein